VIYIGGNQYHTNGEKTLWCIARICIYRQHVDPWPVAVIGLVDSIVRKEAEGVSKKE